MLIAAVLGAWMFVQPKGTPTHRVAGRVWMATMVVAALSSFLITSKSPVIGPFDHPTPPYHFSKTPHVMRTAPCLGEHTRLVCAEMLGMSSAEIVALERDGVFN